MMHDDCDWAIVGECDYCHHRTNPSNMIVIHKHMFCDDECAELWKNEQKK